MKVGCPIGRGQARCDSAAYVPALSKCRGVCVHVVRSKESLLVSLPTRLSMSACRLTRARNVHGVTQFGTRASLNTNQVRSGCRDGRHADAFGGARIQALDEISGRTHFDAQAPHDRPSDRGELRQQSIPVTRRAVAPGESLRIADRASQRAWNRFMPFLPSQQSAQHDDIRRVPPTGANPRAAATRFLRRGFPLVGRKARFSFSTR